MPTRLIVPTLAALAAVPMAQAFEIDSGDWKLSIEPRIQSRLEFASASAPGTSTQDYDIWEQTATNDPQTVNAYFRRLRLYFAGESSDGWTFFMRLHADKLGVSDNGTGSDDIAFGEALVGRKFSSEGFDHRIQFGYDDRSSNRGALDSTAKRLLPNLVLTAKTASGNAIGFDYTLDHTGKLFNLQAGFQIAYGDDTLGADGTIATANDRNDYFATVRVASPLNADWALQGGRSHSYLGQVEGFGHEAGLGVDFHVDGSPSGDNGEKDDDVFINADYLMHYNEWTAAAFISYVMYGDGRNNAGTWGDGLYLSAQGGYAMSQDNGTVIEPAARISYIDKFDDRDENGALKQEGGDSGLYLDVGVNYYLNGHNNKFQAGIQYYEPEEGNGDGFALRLAHNFEF